MEKNKIMVFSNPRFGEIRTFADEANEPPGLIEWPELRQHKEMVGQDLRKLRERSDKLSNIALLISILVLVVQILL